MRFHENSETEQVGVVAPGGRNNQTESGGLCVCVWGGRRDMGGFTLSESLQPQHCQANQTLARAPARMHAPACAQRQTTAG